MADGIIGVLEPGNPSKKLDTEELTVGANTVERERVRLAGGAATELGDVRLAEPSVGDGGAVVRVVKAVVAIQANATVTASGSSNVTTKSLPDQQLSLLINIANAPTGTTPTIVYSIQELDPATGTAALGGFKQSQIITLAGTYVVPLYTSVSNQFKVSWTVTGTTPSFTGVSTTLVSKSTPGSTTPMGEQRVSLPPSQLFVDAWDTGSIDTTDRWTVASAGGGVAATDAGNQMVLGSGTTAGGWATLESKAKLTPSSPAWLMLTWNMNVESAVGTNAYRFWGFGTNPGTPTAALPLTDAVGWEVDINGKLNAVTFASGGRNLIQDLSSATGNNKQPANATAHNYTIFFRGDRIFWCIDSIDNIVAEIPTGALGPDVNVLPLKALAVANTTPPGASLSVTSNAVYLGDLGRNNQTLSDGTFGFRRATVKAASTAVAATDTALAVGIHPTSPLPTGANVIGNVGVAQASTTSGQSGELVQGAVTTAAPAYTTAQTSPLSLTTAGALRHDTASIVGTATVTAAAGVQKVGVVGNAGAAVDGAIAAAPPANAVQIAPKAATANPTNATAGNAVALMADKAGRLVVTPGHVRELVGVQTTTIAASTTETTIITSGGAGVFVDLSALIITMGTTPTACTATIKDATAGTTRILVDLPATTGQGVSMSFPVPIPQAAAANNWTVTLSSAAPTVHINAVFTKNL